MHCVYIALVLQQLLYYNYGDGIHFSIYLIGRYRMIICVSHLFLMIFIIYLKVDHTCHNIMSSMFTVMLYCEILIRCNIHVASRVNECD